MTAAPSCATREPPTTALGIVRSIGPGLILTANVVGTGELIATTKLGAEIGFSLLWFLILGCFIKVFVQVELGRAALFEGIGSLQILDRLPGPKFRVRWVVWLWFIMYLGTFCQMAGMLGGVGELFAGAHGRIWPWALAASASCAGLLLLGRYHLVEKSATVMVVAFTLCNLVAAGLLQGTRWRVTGADLVDGFGFELPANMATAFMVFGITGIGAAEMMFYPIWCLEKGYAHACGPRDDSPEWLARAKGWMHVMRWDAWLSMLVYTSGTIAFYLLGAAILHRQGRAIVDDRAIDTLSLMYTETFGPLGLWVFFAGAFMVLYSTYFVSTASNARLIADLGGMLRVFPPATPEARMKIIRGGIVGIAVVTSVLYVSSGKLVTLVSVGAIAQALMLPFLGFAAIDCRRRIPRALRPGLAWTVFLVIAFLAMATLGIHQAQTGIRKVLGLIT